MTLHLLRTGVGAETIEDMEGFMRENIYTHKAQKVRAITTRYRPTNYEEIVESGGSLYWIIKGAVLVRQKIVDFEMSNDEAGQSFCKILLDPKVVRTESYPHKAIQGWRYLKPENAPKDLTHQNVSGDILPPQLQKELRYLGLL